jgi:hypothetical protein
VNVKGHKTLSLPSCPLSLRERAGVRENAKLLQLFRRVGIAHLFGSKTTRNSPSPQPSPRGRGGRSVASATIKLLSTFLSFSVLLPPLTLADPPSPDTDIPPQVDKAIDTGLSFLARQQAKDGSFEAGGPKIAMTGLTLMAFLACGDTPDQGKYGLIVRSALDFLVKSAPDDGYFGKLDGSRMYGHGIATLALAEAYGVDTDPAKRKLERAVLIKAVDVILKAQDMPKGDAFVGGWRYEPNSPDSDLSLSGWNALALRAARNVGITIPADRVKRAVQFVMRCYRADQKGFSYQPGADASIHMTGVGLLNLYLLDQTDHPEMPTAAKFLVEHPVADGTNFPYYAIYYSTQAAFQSGDPTWTAVWKVTQARLIPTQTKEDGGWPQSPSGQEPGRVFSTSMAILTLTVPYRLLPIYQR